MYPIFMYETVTLLETDHGHLEINDEKSIGD